MKINTKKIFKVPLILVLVFSLLTFSLPAYAAGESGLTPNVAAITPSAGAITIPSLSSSFIVSLLNKVLSLFGGASKPDPTGPQPLRIMPLGASVTYGMGSSSVNYNAGYRGYLQNYLRSAGIKYDMVGSMKSGNMIQYDTDNEGHIGYRIDQIASNATRWLKNNPPDVVILHIGGNDVFQKYKLDEAPARLDALIDQIRANSPSGVKIVVFTLLDTSDANFQPLVTAYNKELRTVVAKQSATHKDVFLAEMEGKIDVKTELSDKQHPNAKGYAKMAISCANALGEFLPEMKTLKVYA